MKQKEQWSIPTNCYLMWKPSYNVCCFGVTEREWWLMQAAKYDPEDKKLAAVSLENMGVKELREYSRKCNAARNRGELNEQFREWITRTEDVYHEKIANIYKVGNHKVQLAYYGMMYTILNYSGCYIMGKNSTPICISRKRYCEERKCILFYWADYIEYYICRPWYK